MTASHRRSDPSPPARIAGAATSVLLVDDDEGLARLIERALRNAGYEVSRADDGLSAEQLVKTKPFDVILSDIQMPGMSGVDLLRAVREHDLDVPVILMTGDPQLETALEAIALGALQYITKPAPNSVLIDAVERAVRLHRLARVKREALQLVGDGSRSAGDLAGLEASFERALASMWAAFQPIVDTSTKTIFGYEALMRAKEPSLPHPGAILDAAERLERLPEIGRKMRHLAAVAFAASPPDTLLFVNLHTRDLLDDDLYDVDSQLSKIASRVVLELTERATLDDVKDITERVGRLRARGFRVAIDDLGAGYAGLSSFAAVAPEIVKLDMSLVRDVHKSSIKQRLIASMTALCREMNIQVVSEGIENAEERQCVSEAGCTLLQGYFYAKPGPPFPAVGW